MTIAPVGIHCILEICGCPAKRLNDDAFVRDAIAEASKQGMSTLLKIDSHKFDPQGVTVFAILAESHISIHTWPENGYAAVDVFTCGETAQPRLACEYLVKAFDAQNYTLKEIPRGIKSDVEQPEELAAT